LGAAFFAYKYVGQQGKLKIEEQSVANDAGRVNNEGRAIDGHNENQSKYIDRSSDLANRQQERSDRELDYRANASNARIELERERLEMERQRQQWEQQQYEKDRARREADSVNARNKAQLCGIYLGNGQYEQARQEGCNVSGGTRTSSSRNRQGAGI
jgi:hypothetical protein